MTGVLMHQRFGMAWIFLLAFVLFQASLSAGNLSNANVEPVSKNVGATTKVCVSFDTASVLSATADATVHFPYDYDISQATFSAAHNIDGSFVVTADVMANILQIKRTGNGSDTVANTSVTLVLSGVKNSPRKGPTGTYKIQTRSFNGMLVDSIDTVTADTMLAPGPFTTLTSLSRRGGVVSKDGSFQLKVAVTDVYGNINTADNSTDVSISPLSSTGSLTGGSAVVVAGISTMNLTYNKREKLALEASATIGGVVRKVDLGDFYFVNSTEAPEAPGTPRVRYEGNWPGKFGIEWKGALKSGVTYEIWEKYSAYMNYSSFNQYSHSNSAYYNDYLNYVVYMNNAPYDRYFDGLSYLAYGNYYSPGLQEAWTMYSGWRLAGLTSDLAYTVYNNYSSLGGFTAYSEFAAYQHYSFFGAFHTNNWFGSHYGAFRIVAVDSNGKRSLPSPEILRGPATSRATSNKARNDVLLPSPENVVVYNENGTVRIEWDVAPGTSVVPDKYYIYKKEPILYGIPYMTYAKYNEFRYFGESTQPTFTFPFTASYGNYHTYTGFTFLEPYGVFKVVGIRTNGERSSSSAPSRTVPFNPNTNPNGVTLDVVKFPSSPVSADHGLDITLRLTDTAGNTYLNDNSTVLTASSANWSSNVTATAQGGYFYFKRLRQYVAGTHTITFTGGGASSLSMSHTVTSAASRLVVRVQGTKITPGQTTYLGTKIGYVSGTTADQTEQVSFQVTVDAVDKYGNVSSDLSGRIVKSIGVSGAVSFPASMGARNLTLTNGTATTTLTCVTSAAPFAKRFIVTADLTGFPGFVSHPSVYFFVHKGIRVKRVEFSDLDSNGSTDSVVVSFDSPINDSTITTGPPTRGFFISHDNAGAIKPSGWHSYGTANDTRIELLFQNPQDSGTVTKSFTYYQKFGKVKGLNGAYVINTLTADNTLIDRRNNQASVVNSSTYGLASRGGTLHAVTLDFSGTIPNEYLTASRWIVVAANGVVLNVTGTGRDMANNKLTVSLDGTLGNTGTPHVGFESSDPNLVINGLVAMGGGTTASPLINITWQSLTDPSIQKYAVFRSTSLNGTYSLLTTTTASVTQDSTIASGTTYYYYLRGLMTGSRVTKPSQKVSASVLGAVPTVSCSATPTSGTAPLTVLFSGTASDTDGQIVQYVWDFNTADSLPSNYTSGTSASTSYTYQESGSYTARLTVMDNSGNSASATVVITVGSPSSGPTANATYNTLGGPAPLAVTFADTSTAGSSAIALWQWDFNADGIFDTSSTVTGNASTIYRLPNRTYNGVKLKVTDLNGRTSTKTFTVTVGAGTNAPQVTLDGAAATNSSGTLISSSGTLPYCVTFSATTYDKAPGKIIRWQWDFNGDGLFDRITTFDRGLRSVTHCYTVPGTYAPLVRVRDNSGLEAEDSFVITIASPTNALPQILEPVTGDRVGGDRLLLRAVATPGSIVSTLLFEYSTDASSWTQTGSTHTGVKPEYRGELSLSTFANGSPIYIRARCTDTQSGSGTSTVVKVFKVAANQAQVYETLSGTKATKEVSLDATLAQEVTTTTGAGMEIPLGAISQDAINLGGLRCRIEDIGQGSTYAISTGLPSDTTNLGYTVGFSLKLSNGSQVQLPSLPVILRMPYPDVNNDGLVDGTSIREENLVVYYYDTGLSSWRPVVGVAVDTAANVVEITTAHLTDFGMFATVVSGAIGGSAGGPGAAASGLCLISEVTAPWSLLATSLLLILAAWVVGRRRSA
ncbi:MAG: PKD domain-containing protein [Planctomycetota bacterium]